MPVLVTNLISSHSYCNCLQRKYSHQIHITVPSFLALSHIRKLLYPVMTDSWSLVMIDS